MMSTNTTAIPKFKGQIVKKFFSRHFLVDIIKVEHEKGTGYHFKITKPSSKNESYYSIPFLTQADAEKGSMMFITSGKL